MKSILSSTKYLFLALIFNLFLTNAYSAPIYPCAYFVDFCESSDPHFEIDLFQNAGKYCEYNVKKINFNTTPECNRALKLKMFFQFNKCVLKQTTICEQRWNVDENRSVWNLVDLPYIKNESCHIAHMGVTTANFDTEAECQDELVNLR